MGAWCARCYSAHGRLRAGRTRVDASASHAAKKLVRPLLPPVAVWQASGMSQEPWFCSVPARSVARWMSLLGGMSVGNSKAPYSPWSPGVRPGGARAPSTSDGDTLAMARTCGGRARRLLTGSTSHASWTSIYIPHPCHVLCPFDHTASWGTRSQRWTTRGARRRPRRLRYTLRWLVVQVCGARDSKP